MYRYRNRSTRQVVEREQRDPRLDRLSHRWDLVEQPAVVEVEPPRPVEVDLPAEPAVVVQADEQPVEQPAPRPRRRRSNSGA